MTQRPLFRIDGTSLTLESVNDHLRNRNAGVALTSEAWNRVKASSRCVDRIATRRERCYGVNTGFGDLSDYRISGKRLKQLQRNLVLSHAVGVKMALPVETSRLLFMLRLNCLARGVSGIRPRLLETLLALYNQQAYPEVYRAGSLGASGDLGPLSHLAAFVIGEGWGYLRGERLPARQIYRRLGLRVPVLSRKEGLSLINGTSAMLAIGVQAWTQMRENFAVSLGAIALALDCFRMPTEFLAASAFALKAHPGSIAIAAELAGLLRPRSGRTSVLRGQMQPVYSLRCAPFILGPLSESLDTCRRTLETEANSANDNPLCLPETESIYHGGHFHGAPVSVALDQLRVAAVHLTGVLDRQLEYFVDQRRGGRAAPFFSRSPRQGYCGFEGAQYLVTSLHAEAKMLANPFSPHTMPTNGGNQDYVSLGMQSALATLEMAENQRLVLSTYLLCIAQGYVLFKRRPQTDRLARLLAIVSEDVRLPYCDEVLMRTLILTQAAPDRFSRMAASILTRST